MQFAAELTRPIHSGIHKFDSLSKFFDSVLDGTADLSAAFEQAKSEEYEEDPEEAEIAKKQEAQRIALMHGGFTDIIDFEKAMAEGGANYHDTAGYGGMMGSVPDEFKKKKDASAEEPSSLSIGTTAGKKAKMPNTESPSASAADDKHSATGSITTMPATTEAAERPKDEL